MTTGVISNFVKPAAVIESKLKIDANKRTFSWSTKSLKKLIFLYNCSELPKLGCTNRLDPYLSWEVFSITAPIAPPITAAMIILVKCILKNNNIEIKIWKAPLKILPIKLKKFLNPFPIIINREPKSTSSSLLFLARCTW